MSPLFPLTPISSPSASSVNFSSKIDLSISSCPYFPFVWTTTISYWLSCWSLSGPPCFHYYPSCTIHIQYNRQNVFGFFYSINQVMSVICLAFTNGYEHYSEDIWNSKILSVLLLSPAYFSDLMSYHFHFILCTPVIPPFSFPKHVMSCLGIFLIEV